MFFFRNWCNKGWRIGNSEKLFSHVRMVVDRGCVSFLSNMEKCSSSPALKAGFSKGDTLSELKDVHECQGARNFWSEGLHWGRGSDSIYSWTSWSWDRSKYWNASDTRAYDSVNSVTMKVEFRWNEESISPHLNGLGEKTRSIKS